LKCSVLSPPRLRTSENISPDENISVRHSQVLHYLDRYNLSFYLFLNPKPSTPNPEYKGVASAEKPCIQREKPCIHGEKPCIQREKPCIHGEKPCVHGEKPCIQREKPCIHGEKPSIQGEKPCIQREKPCIQGEKPCIQREKPCIHCIVVYAEKQARDRDRDLNPKPLNPTP